MTIIKANGAGNQSTDFYNGVATQSLRFDDGSDMRLTRSPSSATNQKKYTFSCWVKRSNLGTNSPTIFGAGNSHTGLGFEQLNFTTGNALRFYRQISSVGNTEYVTTRLFRDTSSWYHIVAMMDAANTIGKIYVNGVRETSFSTENHPTDVDGAVNSTQLHAFGNRAPDGSGGTQKFDGYLAEVNFLDGLNIGETNGYLDEFGEVKNGVWIPKEYTGSYGTNGFRLQFIGTGTSTSSGSVANPTNIGDDSGGSNHHFAVIGLSAHDSNMPDSPENNFATLNPLDVTSATLSDGNLKIVSPANIGANSSFKVSSGKWYAEFYIDNSGSRTVDAHVIVGDIDFVANFTGVIGSFVAYRADGDINGTGGNATFTTGDIIAVAIDADNGTVAWYKDNAVQSTTVSSLSYTAYTPSIVNFNGSGAFAVANFGQDASFAGAITSGTATDGNGNGVFKYAPPSGFLALCSANLPETTISPNALTQADDHFKPVIYSGLNNTAQDISVGFVPDWVWIKTRNASISHMLFDSVRGATKWLQIDAEGTESTGSDSLTDFDVSGGGFSLGADTSTTAVNNNGKTYVSWNWKLGGAPSATNSAGAGATPTAGSVKIDGANLGSALAGSIMATKISASTLSGVSIVTYTGTGSAGTVAHGLGAVPRFYFVKCLDNSASSDHWYAYHGAIASNSEDWESYANLSLQWYENGNYPWNETKPTDSVFSIKTIQDVNESGKKYVAYVFAEVQGFSKFGSYVGNGSDTNGTYVFTGFDVGYVMVKNKSTGSWTVYDNARNTRNNRSIRLAWDVPNSETDTSTQAVQFFSNGFKLMSNNSDQNAGSAGYVYMAFSSSAPFKYANAI